MSPSKAVHALRCSFRKTSPEEDAEGSAREHAAVKIQRAWRAKKHATYLGSNFLWTDLVTHAKFKVDRDAAVKGKNKPNERWKRVVSLAERLQDGNQMMATTSREGQDAATKPLETEHWLELVDCKHRYGANLKHYHRMWKKTDTNVNFFHWLDKGDGKDLSLKECSRAQLEKERIIYLSPEQRLNYLVQIDNEGRLRWARNGGLIDTTAGRWKDAGDGKGIVPVEHPAPGETQPRSSFDERGPMTQSSASSSSEAASIRMHYYTGHNESRNPVKRLLFSFTTRGLLDRLLRKTIRKNTWIYVSDKNFNIFIGIKDPGTFQHSSFLAGGLVTSAGLISVKDGLIHTLSPLSGHYRTSMQHFKTFISTLEAHGIDMHKVKISKAEAALWGIEHVTEFKKKQAKIVGSAKKGVVQAAHAMRRKVSMKARGRHPIGRSEKYESPNVEACENERVIGHEGKRKDVDRDAMTDSGPS